MDMPRKGKATFQGIGIGAGMSIPLLSGLLVSQPARAEWAMQWPMYYLNTSGPKGDITADLLWGLIALSIAVVVITGVLVLVGILVRNRRHSPAGKELLARPAKGVWWIYSGVGISTVVLAAFVAWTFSVMAAIYQPDEEPGLTIEVIGQQWWWGVRYTSDEPSRIIETANEIHIPVGVPVRFELTSLDVIHSFWIPTLGGKTDMIPGRTNVTWLQADTAGIYRGQCAEYCGAQHAHMALRIVAQSPEEFKAWRERQLEPAAPVTSEALREGQRQFVLNCGVCHTVRGTQAGGETGPDLTHLMSRQTIAAGMLENSIGNLSGWIANPQSLKPGTRMPSVDISGPELVSIRDYLLTLD
jgi:cytochrome c oxidase subunit 2